MEQTKKCANSSPHINVGAFLAHSNCKINEELIGQDGVKEHPTGTEVSGSVTGEPKAVGVGERSEQILSELAKQTSNSLDEQLFDDEAELEGPDSPGPTKRGFRSKEEDEDKELSEYTAEQVEHPDEDGDEKIYRRHENNLNEDKSGAPESHAGFQAAPSESQNLPSNEGKGWMENLEFILDIPLQIDIQLGQTKIPLREVLEISSGSLIKLNKSESAPVELLINGKLIAEGQIVVTDGNTLGVQVTSIVNRVERIQSLR